MYKILIVDDDSNIANLYKERLEIERYTVSVAQDGSKALEEIKKNHFDLVLLDIMMPKVGGLDVLDAIKVMKSSKNIPVIMLTALINEEPHTQSLLRGADEYIVKTKTTPKELVEKIKKILAK